jgi:hypothetical protein
MENLNENQLRMIKEGLNYLPLSRSTVLETFQDKMDLINLRHQIKEQEANLKVKVD